MAHTHDVYDTGKYFEINEISRFIKETSSTKLVLVQGDHKSEVITFKMPRLIDGHDMLNCNKIRVHYINIDTKTNDASADIYEVTDLALCEDSEDMLTFTWVVEAPATKYAGTLSFLIKFECTEGENIHYQWNTAKYVGTNVLAGIDNSEEFVEKYSNVLNEWYNELTSGADSIREMNEQSIAGIEVAKENAEKAIEDKTQESLMYFSENARVLQGYKIIDLYAGALEWRPTATQAYVQYTFDESNTDNIAWCTAKEAKVLNFGVFHTINDNEHISGDISKQYYSPDEDFNVTLYNRGQDDNPKWAIFCNMWKSINDPDIIRYVYYKVTIAYAVNIDNTELEDVRVGYDGEVYETAGEAVREQIKKAMQSGGGSVDDEQIKDAVNTYFEENGVLDGFSPIATAEQTATGATITITDKNGTTTAIIKNGKDGEDGADGVGIASIKQTTTSTADDGNNVITITLTNGQKSTFTVKNGSKGSTGAKGSDASVTATNIKNALGYTPAKQTDIDNLSQEIVDQRSIIDGKQPIGNYLTEVPSEYITEDELEAEINDLKAQGIQQTPLFANSVEDMKDTSKVYVLKGTNEIWGYMLTEKEVATGGYTNLLPLATETYNGTAIYGEDYDGDGEKDGYKKDVRLSSSGAISTSSATDLLATGFICVKDKNGNVMTLDGARIRTDGFEHRGASMQSYVISYDANGQKIAHYTADLTYYYDFVLDSATYGTGIKYIRISAGTNGSSPRVVTVNEEIKEGGTTTETVEAWASTGFTFVPADYEDRIVELEREVKKSSNVQNSLGISEVFAPSPQLPADGSETADFNGIAEYITAEHIYAKIDELLNLYPRFITKEVMGKDASGTHDWCRYVCSRRAYDAWQTPNYPPMYAWVNGSTVIYSLSVSPRIGDLMYAVPYIGTSKGTVTAVSNANQTRTVGGVAYARDKSKDVEPTLVYTEIGYSPYFSSNYSNACKGVYDGSKTKISTISSMNNGTMKGANGVTYTRYPLGDRNSKFEEIPSIVIGGNEHGTGGDPATPSMISARMIKDLCECKNANNPFLNLLKNEYMVVVCPVVNPWGLHKNNKSYYNANGVNLDRNLDTVGWGNCPTYPNAQGAYGGSENEMQYFMNTLVASKCKVAMCNHSFGHGLDSTTGEAVSGGICAYMMGRNKTKYTESLLKIAEVMASNYNLVFTDNGEAPPENWAKTRSYFEWIGVDGIALEINSRDGFVTDPNNEAQGKQFTARVMEAGYTQILQVLYMLIDKLDS